MNLQNKDLEAMSLVELEKLLDDLTLLVGSYSVELEALKESRNVEYDQLIVDYTQRLFEFKTTFRSLSLMIFTKRLINVTEEAKTDFGQLVEGMKKDSEKKKEDKILLSELKSFNLLTVKPKFNVSTMSFLMILVCSVSTGTLGDLIVLYIRRVSTACFCESWILSFVCLSKI